MLQNSTIERQMDGWPTVTTRDQDIPNTEYTQAHAAMPVVTKYTPEMHTLCQFRSIQVNLPATSLQPEATGTDSTALRLPQSTHTCTLSHLSECDCPER